MARLAHGRLIRGSAGPAFVAVIRRTRADPPLPSRLVHCELCQHECWLSLGAGDATVREASDNGARPVVIVCVVCVAKATVIAVAMHEISNGG